MALLLGVGFSCSSSQTTKSSQPKEVVKKSVATPIQSGSSQGPSKLGFKDVTQALGLEGEAATHLYAVDWNGDGVTDLVTLPEFYGPPQFYVGTGKSFIKKKVSPIESLVRASFLVFADFDKDGLLDIIAATLNQKSALNKRPLLLLKAHKGKGKTVVFKEIPGALPNNSYATSSISLIDVNMDGLLDLYLGNWFDTERNPPRAQPDRLYLAVEKGLKWKDASYYLEEELKYNSDLEIYPHAGATFGTSLCDLDKNGYPDILTASASGQPNKVWLNLFDRKENDRTLKDFGKKTKLDQDSDGNFSPTGGGYSFYMLCHDYNNDGFMDVAKGELFHSYDPESRDRSSIMTGRTADFPPQFIRTEYHKDDGSGSWSQGDRRAIWYDFNFDSYTDLLVENSGFPPKSRLVLFEQYDDHGYADQAKAYGIDIVNASGSVVMDYDGDGRLDLLMGQVSLRDSRIQPRIYAYKNDFPWEGKRVLKINLKGKRANAHGIGALVSLKTSHGLYTKIHDTSYGPLNSQNQFGLWFGLKKDEMPLQVEVRWPLEKKTKGGRKYPFRKTYPIKDRSFKNYKEITLKE